MSTPKRPLRLRILMEPRNGASYEDILALALSTERAGFDAFFRSDHLLGGNPDNPEYKPTDCWTTLGGLARDTERVRLGALMTASTFRAPGLLATIVASVDDMSGGRAELGIGAAWYTREHAAFGLPFPPVGERFDRLEEQLAIITGLWHAQPEHGFSFDGQHYQVTDNRTPPRVTQHPHPPIIIGGGGPKRTPALAAKFAAEFNVPFAPLDVVQTQYQRVAAAVAAAGRAAESIVYSAAFVICAGRDDAEIARRAAAIRREVDELRSNSPLVGTPGEIVEKLGAWSQLGVQRVYAQLLDIQDLDQLELFAAEVIPQL
jgi:F420-dependent oxidoreductase-like protein